MLLLPNAGKYKCLLQGKGSQIQINIKQLLNSVLVGYEELLRPRFVRYSTRPHLIIV